MSGVICVMNNVCNVCMMKSIYRKNPPYKAAVLRRQGAKPNRERCRNTVEGIRNKYPQTRKKAIPL